MISNISPKVAAAALALCVALPVSANLAHAKVCKSYSVSKTGGKKWTNISARTSARLAWHSHVKQNIGFVWSVYAMAKNKGFDCKRKGVKWQCTAYGRPCRAGN